MKDMWEQLHRWWEAGTPCGLATVVSAYGSAPRQPGALMVCAPDGTVTGSVSGGCVEASVITEAIEIIASGSSKMLQFGVADEIAWRAGLSCGGRISIFVEPVI